MAIIEDPGWHFARFVSGSNGQTDSRDQKAPKGTLNRGQKGQVAKRGRRMPMKGNRSENEIDYSVVSYCLPNGFWSGSSDFAIQIEVTTVNGFKPLIMPPKGGSFTFVNTYL
jgi:hypothetical protein